MQPLEHKIRAEVGKAVSKALQSLLCEKHLYQCVNVDKDALMALSKLTDDEKIVEGFKGKGPVAILDPVAWINTSLEIPWILPGCNIKGSFADILFIPLPSINTFCSTCKSRQPFKFVEDMSASVVRVEKDEYFNQDQTYHLSYECQQCQVTEKRQAPYVRFLVRRDKLKLRLCGRDPIEIVPAPKELPEPHSQFFGMATMAYNTGQTLAGIFLLRTFIEQYWRSLPAVQDAVKAMLKENVRPTGDEQGNAYNETLPVFFRGSVPSLSGVYGSLSAAMHEAKADPAVFEDCLDRVLQHFEARKAHRLDVTKP
jgi:hypothetical protein